MTLLMVSFRVKVWVTYIVSLSNGIFRSPSRGRLIFFSFSICYHFFFRAIALLYGTLRPVSNDAL